MIGRMIGSYRIDRSLGEGSVGAVYFATDVRNQQGVALKLIHAHLGANPQFIQQFTQILDATAALQHNHIARVLDHRLQPGESYLISEYMAGGNLHRYLKSSPGTKQPIGPTEAVRVGEQIAQALDYAHRLNSPHFNLKPSNVLMKPEGTGRNRVFRAIVSDFGIGWVVNNTTRTATLTGNLAYWSPEQIRGERVDHRADIYALGVLLYEITTGRPPFQPRSFNDALRIHANETVIPPSQLVQGVPPELVQLIMGCLARNPNDRIQSAAEVGRGLQAVSNSPGRGLSRPVPIAQGAQLKTSLESGMIPVESPSVQGTPPSPSDAGRARLLISHQGQQPSTVWVDKDVMLIGRDRNQDVVLDSVQVSRSHARLDRGYDGRFRIMDFGSTNGVWIGNSRIPASTPTEWRPGQAVRIGDFWIHLEVIAAPSPWESAQQRAGVVNLKSMPPAVAPARGLAERTTDRFTVKLFPAMLPVAPGNRVIMKVEVENTGDTADRFSVDVRGLPSEWVTLASEQAINGKGGKGVFQVTLHPPKGSSSVSGSHSFAVVVSSIQNPAEYSTQTAQLQIEPYYGFVTDLQPKRLRANGVGEVLIQNTGNTRDTYLIFADDVEQQLEVNLNQTQVTVEPGQTERVLLRVNPRHRPLLGSNQDIPLRITTKTVRPTGEQQQISAMQTVTPRLPYWALGAIGVSTTTCTLAALLGLFVMGSNLISNSDRGTGGSSGENGTTISITLSSSSDTDGDGLTDDEELRSYRTTYTNPDSDNDNLNDGTEVFRRTSPLNADTDGDGIPDGADSLPLMTPSPTIDVIATQTAAQGAVGATDAAVTQTALSNQLQTQIAASTQVFIGLTQTAQAAPTATPTPSATPTATATPSFTPTPTPTPIVSQISVSDPISVIEGGTMVFSLILSQPASAPAVTISYTISGGAGVTSSDTSALGTATVQIGGGCGPSPCTVQSQISIAIQDDPDVEGPEQLFLTVNPQLNLIILKGTGTGTILDNDPAVPAATAGPSQASINDPPPVMENAGPIVFTVVLYQPPSAPAVNVGYSVSGLDATDISPPTTQIASFSACASGAVPCTKQTGISVGLVNDGIVENNEQFSVILDAQAGVTINDGIGVGTILNDDFPTVTPLPPPTATLLPLSIASINDASSIGENDPSQNMTFMVTLIQPLGTPVIHINFDISYSIDGDNTANFGAVSPPATLSFPACSSASGCVNQQMINITLIDTGCRDTPPIRTITIRLIPQTGVDISRSTGIGSVADNEVALITVASCP